MAHFAEEAPAAVERLSPPAADTGPAGVVRRFQDPYPIGIESTGRAVFVCPMTTSSVAHFRAFLRRYAMFFAHFALERALKAHVCRHTGDLALRTHGLARLAEVAAVEPTTSHLRVLSILNEFSQAGRYPDDRVPLPTLDQARLRIGEANEALQ